MPQFAPLLRKDEKPVRYLVVDDSVFARKNIIKMIELFGGEVAGEAGDGLTAIAEFKRTAPDIVLMDITMPKMDGLQALKEIRKLDPSARVAMVTAMGQQALVMEALKAGARVFVLKPFRADRMLASLQKLLAS